MTDATTTACLRAATALWERLAALAWEQYTALGRGVLMVDEGDLLAAADGAKRALEPGFVPLSIVPQGDDFRGVLLEYDPQTQVPLLVRGTDGGEQLIVLERHGTARPSPEACFHARRGEA